MTDWTQIEIVETPSGAAADVVFAFTEPNGGYSVSEDVGRLSDTLDSTGFEAKPGRWLDVLPATPQGKRILVLGGERGEVGDVERWIGLGGHLIDAMTALRLKSVQLPPSQVLGGCEALEALLLGCLLHSFRFATGRKTTDPNFLPEQLLVAPADLASIGAAQRTARAVNRARAWVEAPANRLTPATWPEELSALTALGIKVRVLTPEDLESIGAHAILAVGRGAEHGPRLAVLEWRGAPERTTWDAAMVGKGLTFDGGGLNLKPRPGIEKMKFDMGGGAAVIGALELAASRKTRCNVAVIVPMVENAIDALSYRPGDVIGSLAGLTIEILNTDAEGRLVLADGVAYALQTYQPDTIVDVATLTGSIMGVLHEEFAALYANDDALANGLLAAGDITAERLWRMPLVASQDYLVESTVADVANLGAPGLMGAGAGSPAAGAKLIQKFAGDARWAHIDIAGTAWSTRRTALSGKGATGFGVRLLAQWLRVFEAT
jgi:leucyl aminopeptidase